MNFLKSILILITLICMPYCSFSQLNTEHTYKNDRLNQLISADSIYEATLLLNNDITYAETNNLPLLLANTNQELGTIFSGIESYETAESYYLRAFQLFDSLNNKVEVDHTLTDLSRTYVNARNYKKFDSLGPIALKHSYQLNSINIFYNLGSKLIRNYALRKYDVSLKFSNVALLRLDTYTFATEDEMAEKERMRMTFSYYKALSLINLNQFEEGYGLLFTIDPDQIHFKKKHNTIPLNQLATLNYYKFRYFNERTKHADSANYYLLKSDSLKYITIKEYQNKLSKNGDLIYKIISTENELQLANSTTKQDQALSKIFLVATIVLGLLLGALVILFFYYNKIKKRIQKMNLTLKESNKKLKIIDKERLEFFSILSHELRTPIYGINGLATLIEQEQSPEKRKGYLNALISSSNYISVLIDNVLQISKLKFENKKLHLKPTDILKLVNRISSSIKVSADEKGLILYTNVEKNNWDEYLLIDKVVLSQILINLSYNAIRYTSKGSVSIELTEQKRTNTHVNILFEIKDSGIGIQNKHRDIIFNAFENKTFLEKNSSGSGLGLYIVKTLLKSYNADIKFLSKPNEGSTFYFDIDFEIAKSLEEIYHQSAQLNDTPTKVLVVDDNTINLMITQKNVEKIPGYMSGTATNGKEAICLVKEKDFDLVLMDINMPDMDGFEATRHIRLFNPNIPILALTALNSSEIHSKAMACGMNHVITKPYDFEEFKSIILKYRNVQQD
ncbi:response regulator [Gelidibacter salicanalis]|uniref:histidine kinase n=1 Tax=Gelidibacter salicanalis TaxID=291193 RepID=A0A934KX37_9FLAO|nr:response regulator [Gelidibacter salicanalis]MBJ7882177.1 response regulator [Gelidibacter salicanalis]